jgi:sugar phosphate permease
VYVGTIVGGTLAGVIAEYYGWRWSFILFGGLGVLLGLVLRGLLREPQRGAAEDIGFRPVRLPIARVIKLVWSTPTALLLMFAFLCANFVAVVLLSWMPKFIYDQFHMSLGLAGLTATLYVQLASLAGSVTGGWMADAAARRTARGRILVQVLGVFGGAPFVALCGMTRSVWWLCIALTAWGFFKGLYDANIFASVFDVIRPEARGTAAGFMNSVGWLGGGTAPVVIGLIAGRYGVGVGITLASFVYIAAGLLLLTAAIRFVKSDTRELHA